MNKETDALLEQLLQYHSTLPEETFIQEITIKINKRQKLKQKLVIYALIAAVLLAMPLLLTLNLAAFSSLEFLVASSSLLLLALLTSSWVTSEEF
ncbi:hypothetical protein [Thalassotalea ganghwensis]